MNPTDPTSPTPESDPHVPKPVNSEPSPPELPTAPKPVEQTPQAEAQVEIANPESKPKVISPIILPTAHPVKDSNRKIRFHREAEPEDDYDKAAEEEYLARKRKGNRVWIVILLVFLSLMILVPVAFVIFLFVICGGMSNNGRF